MIFRNSVICKRCKREIESKHRHDYVSCKCGGANVDGGKSYLRRGGDYRETSVTSESPHELVREFFEWGSYGVKGDEPLKKTKLINLEESHIKNILRTCPEELKKIFNNELEYRNEKIRNS